MILQEILRKKGSQVFTITAQATVDEAVQNLVENNVGSLLVCEESTGSPSLQGIITERDILRVLASHCGSLEGLKVGDVMTTELVTVAPTEATVQARKLMTEHRIRHLPVVVDGQLCGMISIGDIVKRQHELLEQDNHFMRSYIQGEGAERGTLDRPR